MPAAWSDSAGKARVPWQPQHLSVELRARLLNDGEQRAAMHSLGNRFLCSAVAGFSCVPLLPAFRSGLPVAPENATTIHA